MEQKGNAARGKILRQFRYLIRTQGCKKTTIRQLCDSCKMSPGHIRFYFPKREDLDWAIYLNFSYKINKVIRDIHFPEDALLELLFSQLVKYYISIECESIFRVYAELSENSDYIIRRIDACFEDFKNACQKSGIHADENSILIGATGAIHSVYGIVNCLYTRNLSWDYKQVFRIFVNSLFVLTDFPQKDTYIEKSLELFAQQDKKRLIKKYHDLEDDYYR